MNLPELKALLEKYYNGESSGRDNERIVHLLSEPDLPSEFWPDRELFLYIDENQSVEEPGADFEGRIMERIDLHEKEKVTTGFKRRIYLVTSAAALILILITTYLSISSGNKITDTFDDPLIAYNETRKILYEVSFNLNRGQAELSGLNYINDARGSIETITSTTKMLGQELSPLKYLNRGIEISGMIVSSKQPE